MQHSMMEGISHRGERLRGAALTEEFFATGCVKVPKLLSPELVDMCRACFRETLDNPMKREARFFAKNKETGESYVYNEASGLRGAEAMFEDLLLNQAPVIPEACRALWGSKSVWLMGHEIFKKIGGEEGDQHKRTPFHQDGAVFPAHGPHLVNCWIPLEDFTPKENCLEMVVGSHNGPLYAAMGMAAMAGDGSELKAKKKKPTVEKTTTPSSPPGPTTTASEEVVPKKKEAPGALPPRLQPMPTPGTPEFEKWEIAQWELEKGDVVFLHPSCIHGGGRVSVAFPERTTLVFRLFGDDCVYRELPRFRQAQAGSGGVEPGAHFSRTGTYRCLVGPGLLGLPDAADALRVTAQDGAAGGDTTTASKL